MQERQPAQRPHWTVWREPVPESEGMSSGTRIVPTSVSRAGRLTGTFCRPLDGGLPPAAALGGSR